MQLYPIPAEAVRNETLVVNSRFIASLKPVFSVEEARQFVAQIRAEFADASHNVPAYLVGFGSSVIAHCSDDGEPSGTAGRPALAVLQGSGLGDTAVVVTRYFGGTKLGKGGLVRAYSDAVRAVLEALPLARKVQTHNVMIVVPYNWFDRLRLLIGEHGGLILDEDFAADVTVSARFAVADFTGFQAALSQASHGSLQAEIIESGISIIPFNTQQEEDNG